jgi:hypothetical protein
VAEDDDAPILPWIMDDWEPKIACKRGALKDIGSPFSAAIRMLR